MAVRAGQPEVLAAWVEPRGCPCSALYLQNHKHFTDDFFELKEIDMQIQKRVKCLSIEMDMGFNTGSPSSSIFDNLEQVSISDCYLLYLDLM